MTDASPVDTDRFRREVRGFLKEHLPGWLRDKVLRHEPLVKTDYLAWQSVLLERGWMCTTWPTRYGGPGWTPMQTHIFEEECWLFGAPDVLPFGTKMLAPLIMGYIGKEKQSSGVNSGGGLGDLLGGILGGAQNQAQAEPSNPLNDILGSVLGGGSQQSSGNPLNDILGSVLGGGQQQQQQQGGLGGLLGSILGGK